jgi:hypothetical protein
MEGNITVKQFTISNTSNFILFPLGQGTGLDKGKGKVPVLN